MGWSFRRARAGTLAALLALVGVACSDADPIEPKNGNVAPTVTASPAYSGRFQRARFRLIQITARPLDAQANALLTGPMGLLQSPSDLDLRSTSPITVATTVLQAGSYGIETLVVSSFELNVVDEDSGQTLACSGGQVTVARSHDLTSIQFASPRVFQVTVGTVKTVNITVDGSGLVDSIEAMNLCALGDFPTPSSAELLPFFSVE